tara:strand:+ start:1399 stop:1683 length:285 start_codon:yes stop_codon:yes gene_type:complete
MKIYKNQNGDTFAYEEDGSQDHLISSDLIPISEEEEKYLNDIKEKQRFDSLNYQEKRRISYPPIGEQLDYIYHNGVEAWKVDMIQPIKNKYPKE